MITLWADAHIFVYHRFGDSRYPTTNTTIQELNSQFQYFKDFDYKVIPLNKLVYALKHKKNIPDNWVVLTIDDSFKSFYKNGLALFKKYNYPFSLFVYVEASLKKYPDYLTWAQLKEISNYGSLEFHSYAHPHMTNLSDKVVKNDFKKGLKIFKKKLGIAPKYFSYPYGEYDNRIKKIAKSFEFDAIINQNIGAVGAKSDVFDLDRNALVGKTRLRYLLKFKFLDAKWIKPLTFPKNNILETVHIKTNENAKQGSLYISGYGWKKVKITNGGVFTKIDKKLIKGRNRVIISINDKISTKLLIKDNQWN